MKVVLVDNLNRDYYSDVLLADNLSKVDAEVSADIYNKKSGYNPDFYAMVKSDEYCLKCDTPE